MNHFHVDVIAFARANKTSEVMMGLIDRAAEVSHLDPDGLASYDKKDWGVYWSTFKMPSSWAEPLGGWAELHAREEDVWAYSRVGEPAFGTGFTLPIDYYERLRDSSQRQWLGAWKLRASPSVERTA